MSYCGTCGTFYNPECKNWPQCQPAPNPHDRGAAMVKCGKDLAINPAHVMSLEWDRRSYANGPGASALIITLTDGRQHRIEHTPQYLDGTDCYAIEKAILASVGDT